MSSFVCLCAWISVYTFVCHDTPENTNKTTSEACDIHISLFSVPIHLVLLSITILSANSLGFAFHHPRREVRGFLMSPPLSGNWGLSVWSHFSIFPLLFFCLACCSFCLILCCFWPILLSSFSLNLHFAKGRLFCVALVFSLFERLGDEYVSWWYVQHMLLYLALVVAFTLSVYAYTI